MQSANYSQNRSMKFCLELRARASENVSIEQKHSCFVQRLLQVAPPWGLNNNNLPASPSPGSKLIASFNLGNCLGKVAKGNVYYQFRRPFRDEACHDDFLDLTFNVKKIDFRLLAYEVFPHYIAAFDPYLGLIQHDEFSYQDFEVLNAMRYNPRRMVYRVAQVAFFDTLLCNAAFGLAPEAVAGRLKKAVEHTQLLPSGVLVIGSSNPLDFADADRLSREVRQLLS
jgi:hypothetical protein